MPTKGSFRPGPAPSANQPSQQAYKGAEHRVQLPPRTEAKYAQFDRTAPTVQYGASGGQLQRFVRLPLSLQRALALKLSTCVSDYL